MQPSSKVDPVPPGLITNVASDNRNVEKQSLIKQLIDS